jgi:aminopeptidase YwaD
MKINISLKLIILASISILTSCGQNREVTVKELETQVGYLSSDSLKGRDTGAPGDSLAAEFIRKELTSCGFQPLPRDGFQRFSVTTRLAAGKNNSLSINGTPLTSGDQFMPLSFSSNSDLKAEVVFAGYGFNINEDSLKWNDYIGIDVNGKWVMVFRADPETDNAESPFIPHSSDRIKALVARDMGAAGVLLVSGEIFDPQDSFEALNANDLSVGIPVIRIKRSVAQMFLSEKGKEMPALEKEMNSKRKPESFSTGVIADAKAEIIRETGTTRNVVMLLPGEDETLKNEYVIIGAHFDHLGMGGIGSSSMSPDTIAVHHGADDNASGVSLMMEIAEKFALTKGSHPRSIICVAFSGEEKGLLGSKFFVNNPGIDLSKVNAMVNLDMVGRLQESDILQISGVGTSARFRELITSLNDTSSLKLALTDAGYGNSDHSSFYSKNIPVLFFTTGGHLDYHKPSDTFDKINYPGMIKVSSLVYKVTSELVTNPEKEIFMEAGPMQSGGRPMRRKSVTLGIMPDFNGNEKNGLRADIVTPGKPGALGGMKNGDIITAINGKAISNIYDYMSRMGQLKTGQTITVEIMRDGNKMTLIIQL